MKRKILALGLVLCMVVSMFPVLSFAAGSNNTGIEIGDYVQMGSYDGDAILWRCVDIDNHGPLMLSDKMIMRKAYDAPGTVTKGSHARGFEKEGVKGYYRLTNGSNYWGDSNLRCWLNSTAAAGKVKWTCGNPPVAGEMSNEAGFLTNFTRNERACMKTVTQPTIIDYAEYEDMSAYGTEGFTRNDSGSQIENCLNNYDKAYKKNFTDTMFVLDVKQVYAVYKNGEILGDTYFIGQPTDKVKETIESGHVLHTWLRNVSAFNVDAGESNGSKNSSHAAYLGPDGKIFGNHAMSEYAVRPAFYLDSYSAEIVSGTGTADDPYILYADDPLQGLIKNVISYIFDQGSPFIEHLYATARDFFRTVFGFLRIL